MTKQEKMIKDLECKYSEWLEMTENKEAMMINIMASLLVKLDDDLDTFKKVWKREMVAK